MEASNTIDRTIVVENEKSDRPYYVLQQMKLPVASAVDQKQTAEYLASIATTLGVSDLQILVVAGSVRATRIDDVLETAVENGIKLNGDYAVTAVSSVKEFPNISTKTETKVVFG